MEEAFIVDAVRTPVGKRGGSLAGMHSAALRKLEAPHFYTVKLL